MRGCSRYGHEDGGGVVHDDECRCVFRLLERDVQQHHAAKRNTRQRGAGDGGGFSEVKASVPLQLVHTDRRSL